jgi:hypothetical protein
MNLRQVTVLWLVAIALGGAIAFVKLGQQKATTSNTARATGATLLEKFPATEVAAIDIQGAGGNATSLAKKDGKWTVAQREDYPANVTTVNGFLRTIEELKVTQGIRAGASLAPRFGLDESASTADKRGLTATFKDVAGKEIAKISIDQRKDPESPASPFGGSKGGKFVRNHQDDSGIYRVSESFSDLTDDPKRWLAEDFVKVDKIKSIAVTNPDQTDIAWKLTRDSEEGQFALAGAAPGETLDTTATDPLKNLLSYARIEDVIPAAKVAERAESKGKRVATIETLEGFVYTITFTPLKATTPPPAPDPSNPAPPAADNFAVTVDVKAELPKERKKEANEKPEDAKTKDAAFTERLKALTEQLEKEQKLANRTFEIAKYTLEALLKDRASLIKKDAPSPAPNPGQPGAGFPGAGFPGAGMPTPPPARTGPIEAVTPPIAIPPMPPSEPTTPPAGTPPADKPAEPATPPAGAPPVDPAAPPAGAPPAATPHAGAPPTEPATPPAGAPPAEPTTPPAGAPPEPAAPPAGAPPAGAP